MDPISTIEPPPVIRGIAFRTVNSVARSTEIRGLVKVILGYLLNRERIGHTRIGDEDVEFSAFSLHDIEDTIQVFFDRNVALDRL